MALRDTNLDKLDNGDFDVLIVGGGINGAVSAAALSARGASVALIDRMAILRVSRASNHRILCGEGSNI